MSFNQPAPHLLDGDPLPEQRLQAIDGQEQIQILEQIHNNRVRPPWSVRRARLEGEDIGTINNMIGSSQGISGRPANHEDSLSDALEGPAADEWSFREPNHSNGLLSGLNDLRKSTTFCDIVVQVGGREFSAHKAVLSAASNYFKAMFTCDMAEAQTPRVTINGLEPSVAEQLIDYFYTAEIRINQHNVQNILSAANLLDVPPVREAASRYLDQHMDETNCLGIQSFAEIHSCHALQRKAKAFALRHFSEVARSEEFESISENQLIDLIGSDDLETESGEEEEVFRAVMRWAESSSQAITRAHETSGSVSWSGPEFVSNQAPRFDSLHNVLSHVRLPRVSPYFLHDCVATERLVNQSKECMQLVEEARLYHLLPDRRSEFGTTKRCKPRKNAGTTQVIVSVGGEDDKVVLRSVEYWDPSSNLWKQLACLPFAVSKHGLVASGQNRVYMAGGEYPDGSASKAVWRYDPTLDIWQEVESMQTPRSELGLALLDGFVYAVGGWEGTSRLDSVERYNPETNTWSSIPNLRMAVTSPAVITNEGCLYVCGGAILEDGDGIDLVQKYDSKTNEWTEAASMLIPRSGSAACVLDKYIYVIGGWHASTENTNKVERYDVHRNKWTSVCPMLERRYRPGVSVLNNKIYVMGGEEGWDRYHDTIEAYDPIRDVWENVGEMPSSRSWLSCVPLMVKVQDKNASEVKS